MIPLRTHGDLVGLLSLHSADSGYFSEENIQIALEVTAQIAIGIHKSLQTDALARYAQRMEILHEIDLG